MKKIILILALAAVLIGCGDTTQYSQDSVMEMKRYGAFSPQDWVVDVVRVEPGKVYHVTYGHRGEVTRNTTKQISEQRYKSLLESFRKAGFMEHEDVVRDIPVVDVGMANITMIVDGQKNVVHIDPLYELPSDMDDITEEFNNLRAYALQMTSEEAEALAEEWIKESPTYSFDGYGLGLQDHTVMESYPTQHVLTYTFESRHAGYGNRSGQMLAQVITPHEIVVKVANRRVVSAVLDEEWDVMRQEMISRNEMDEVEETTGAEEMEAHMRYDPEQCEQDPWREWYEAGNINYVKEPSDEQLIIDYYSSKGVDLRDVKKESREGAVCMACGCPSTHYYTLWVDSDNIQTLKSDGWKTSPELVN